MIPYQKIAVDHMLHRERFQPNYVSHALEGSVNNMKYNYITGMNRTKYMTRKMKQQLLFNDFGKIEYYAKL